MKHSAKFDFVQESLVIHFTLLPLLVKPLVILTCLFLQLNFSQNLSL